ncbi:33861_t:CDS:1, partial [Racocetra persica]
SQSLCLETLTLTSTSSRVSLFLVLLFHETLTLTSVSSRVSLFL